MTNFSFNIKLSLIRLAVIVNVSALLFGCMSTKHIPEGEHLLVKNKVFLDSKTLSEDDISGIIKQTPNSKILLIRFHMRVYNFSSRGKQGRIKVWMQDAIGEEPVILNDALTSKSSKQIQTYLKNKGYFNAQVTDSIHYKKRKKAENHFSVKPAKPYTIGKITYAIDDENLIRPIRSAVKNTTIKPGVIYDNDVFTSERERVAGVMKNMGYYDFNQNYIFYEMDSALGTNQVNVTLKVTNPVKPHPTIKDSLVGDNHRVLLINNIYINSNYEIHVPNTLDTIMFDDYHFVNASNIKYQPKNLLKAIYIRKSDIYRQKNVKYTYNRLGALKTFKSTNIRFRKIEVDGREMLDCYIDLTNLPKHSFGSELQATSSNGNFGTEVNFTYGNKNTFKGAELFQIELFGGMDVQNLTTSTESDQSIEALPGAVEKLFPFFNSVESGINMSLMVPRMFTVVKVGKLPKVHNPHTKFSTSYNFQETPSFRRNISSLNYGYTWRSTQFSTHNLGLFDMSLVKIRREPEFDSFIKNFNNPFLANTYSDHLVSSSQYQYTYSNQNLNKFKNFMFFKGTVESAGNMLRLISQISNLAEDSTGSYRLFNLKNDLGEINPESGLQFAHYVKSTFDLRLYRIMNRWSKMVYRGYIGVGIPLVNFPTLPFQKSFFGGGANGIRAWQSRSLGPGSYHDFGLTAFDRVGDIHLEGNMEYRFNMFEYLEGAFFTDFGNIWTLKKDTLKPDAEFDFGRFYNDVAVGSGIGLRVDLSFFLIRFDFAFPIRDPILNDGEKWVFQSNTKYNNWRLENLEKTRAFLAQHLPEDGTVDDQNTVQVVVDEIDRFVTTGEYKYRIKPVLSVGIGYPF